MNLELAVQDNFSGSAMSEIADQRIDRETWQGWFEIWFHILQADLPVASGYELSLRLSDDAEIQQLNCQYRYQDRPTDVLSFAALEVDFPQPDSLRYLTPMCLGDIVISVETAQRQAHKQGHSLATELAWLAAHGLLHLLGWDHPDEESLTEMLRQQETLLEAIGLAVVNNQINNQITFTADGSRFGLVN